MAQSISLNIPDSVVQQTQQLAIQGQKRLEDILLKGMGGKLAR
ncbi:MAG: hypothetical protein AAGC93_28060 [Cyanobacteria bacterium P01_F01_bin.53]